MNLSPSGEVAFAGTSRDLGNHVFCPSGSIRTYQVPVGQTGLGELPRKFFQPLILEGPPLQHFRGRCQDASRGSGLGTQLIDAGALELEVDCDSSDETRFLSEL